MNKEKDKKIAYKGNKQSPEVIVQESDRALSGALIGGAFGFIGTAIFSSASYADKVPLPALFLGNIFSTISVVVLLISIIFGGKGWTGKKSAGWTSHFNMQALLGLFGILMLCVSACIFAFNPKKEVMDREIAMVNERISNLEAQSKYSQLEIEMLREEISRVAVELKDARAVKDESEPAGDASSSSKISQK